MAKSVRGGALYVIAGLAAYLLLRLGEFVSTGLDPDSLTINAFLFLMGLGGALTLLGPISRPRRIRW